MILKSIDLRGFKSFPEKTLIEFTDGITAIIGPNGSGKSNISDAVRWVLGEMSTKTLRGSKMEDVIFNGANGTAPATFASVSLTLDTSSEYASTAVQNGEEQQKKAYSLSDAPEVTVTRKLYRTGESEYYINKKLVRLKDIYELFYDTGIGREGYSVIGQGKIAEVLSRRDEERRSIFEEAAGISKYRYKKMETERKLRDTQTNLVRVNDILTEIKTRIVPLEKEAENAKKYIELSEEKKGLEITLWLDRIDSVRAKLKANETHTAAVKLQYDGVSARLAENEDSLDKTITDTHELTKKYSDSESSAAETAKLIADAENALSVAEADIRHLSAAKLQSSAGIEFSRSQLDSLEKDLAEATKTQEQARGELEALKAEYDSLDAEYAKEKEIISTVQEKTAQAEKASAALSDELNAIEIEKASLSAGMELRSGAQTQRGENLASLEEEAKALQAIGEGAAKQADAAQTAVTEAEKAVAAAAIRVTAGAEQAAQRREKVQEQRIKLAATQQKRENLERMERLLEGYSDSVKTLLTAVREFKLRRTVYGTVSSLLSTTDEYVVAVETALGAGVQN
ncbi:MAG TPA: AAA family ATPase, partial [Bacillota bacterium]|nr:AAA family ATPase [Bacillota bacterium]